MFFQLDDSRFTNHSQTNNNITATELSDEIEFCGVANRDIEPGEELITNYRLFDAHDMNSGEDYLNN